MQKIDASVLDLKEKVVNIGRVTKVVKGGRNFRFAALVVIGDENGHVGVGSGKAAEIPNAIRKGIEDAKKNLIKVPTTGTTIPTRASASSEPARFCFVRRRKAPASSQAVRFVRFLNSRVFMTSPPSRSGPTTRPTWFAQPSKASPSSVRSNRSRSSAARPSSKFWTEEATWAR